MSNLAAKGGEAYLALFERSAAATSMQSMSYWKGIPQHRIPLNWRITMKYPEFALWNFPGRGSIPGQWIMC